MNRLGGNAAIVMSQMLLSEQSKVMPKLQILIYPWLHVYSHLLPSSLKYKSDLLQITELVHWYLGITNFTQEMEEAISSQHIFELLEEEELTKIRNYLDIANLTSSSATTCYRHTHHVNALE